MVGYWLGRRAEGTAPRMCERHMKVITILDQQEDQRLKAEELARAANEVATREAQAAMPDAQTRARLADLEARKANIVTGVQAPTPPTIVQPSQVSQVGLAAAIIQMPPVVPPPATGPVQPAAMFALGPGPLTNENQVTAPPPPPVAVQLPIDNSVIKTGLEPAPTPQTNPHPPGPQEGAALIDAPCLFCQVMVKRGEVHNCPQAKGRGN